MNFKNHEKAARIATIGITAYLLCFGIAMAFFPIRPFWNDEWRLIYNIKFKNVSQLWGTLDLLQECPRCYLTLLKIITAYFDYNYTSMRLPPLVIGVASIFLIFYLKRKILPGSSIYGYLFILIFISSKTFTDYLTQVKQYEIELFLCLLAVWQFMALLEICKEGAPGNKYKYLLLCFSFLAAPFFSYDYPIAVAPAIPIIVFNSIISLRKKQPKNNKTQFLPSLYIPLFITCASILIFYLIDVKQVMADQRMYLSYISTYQKGGKEPFIVDFWKLFSLVGSGFLYEIIFGILGVVSFFYGIYRLAQIKKYEYTTGDYVKLYGVFLLILTLCLFFSGKLIGGVARLTAFAVPSIALLIVSFLGDLKTKYGYIKLSNRIAAILFIGLYGNMLTTCINTFTYPEYSNYIETYWNTSQALKQARLEKVPILFTDGVRGRPDIKRQSILDIVPILFTYRVRGEKAPGQATAMPGKIRCNTIDAEQLAGTETLCAEVILKVNPEYKVWDPIPAYLIPDMKWAGEYMKQLPANFKSAIACDGINIVKLTR